MNNPIQNAKIGLVALAVLAGGAFLTERVVRTPINLRNVQYTGYRTEKSDGTIQVYFQDKNGKTSLSNRDGSFNPDREFRQSKANPSLRYNISGYHSPIWGNYATNIKPIEE